ncbi:MAG: acetyl-CoA carboxylase subunit beta [Omnitrophica bacterium RIFCSPLOWO2_02_FULL_45_16]|nr:MAG: acetyl-CoA carboxylase subunit beta [Omnitrophica bacterium RIFCSPHIGHO2_02_FULL_46_20]OGW92707.1 MAG: acetyl-CoA carboxylase subunit beta [Omnitrophica bacterium RIFCSPLOWO2_12_FULL_45_13]OGW93087.1 MAG: acetyl-CoA carboxylase subunit beta [Omnitrophica bacterium RIFCSPLOWO2_01_FULL_45_24]OGX00449.1 MAG: acetyl-CoA carboxylase subunit beta [Omnitrophica bacterium RIFCSPLOWO2_02_FULL_45_16]
MPLFPKKPKYTIVRVAKKRGDIPSNLWTKCEDCKELIYNKKLEENFRVCPKCNFHFNVGAYERVKLMLDEGSFKEMDADMESLDPLSFEGPKTYKEKIKKDQELTNLKEAVITGEGAIYGKRIVLGVTDSRFIMGSMGSVVGEKLTRAIERSIEIKNPLVIISGSGGGARMYEGMYSLMQMAKTSVALSRHNKAGCFFISILTNPTMAGIMASFASLGDLIIAEPKALIGFTGPRVIEQTIRQRLPPGFQKSEFLLEHGLIDMIVHRKNLKETISKILNYF